MEDNNSKKFDFVYEKDQNEFGKLPKGEQKIAMEIFEEENVERNNEGESNGLESGTTAPIIAVYRDNDLFEKYVPKIEKYIKSIGGEIKIKSFPRGTENDQIDNWKKNNANLLSDNFLFADETCSRFGGKLEKMISSVITNSVWDQFGTLGENKPRNIEVVFKNLFKDLFGKEGSLSNKKIILIKNHIADHVREGMPESIKNIKDDLDIYLDREDRNRVYDTIIEIFVRYLKEAGYSTDDLTIKEDLEISESNLLDNSDNCIIIDRHNVREIENIKNATVLRLPLSNFINDLSKFGLINLSDKIVEERLDSYLATSFKKVPTFDNLKIYINDDHDDFIPNDTLNRMSDEEIKKSILYAVNRQRAINPEHSYGILNILNKDKIPVDLVNTEMKKIDFNFEPDLLNEGIINKEKLVSKLDAVLFKDFIGKELKSRYSSKRKIFQIDGDHLKLVEIN